jgi:hypothetical protein
MGKIYLDECFNMEICIRDLSMFFRKLLDYRIMGNLIRLMVLMDQVKNLRHLGMDMT